MLDGQTALLFVFETTGSAGEDKKALASRIERSEIQFERMLPLSGERSALGFGGHI